MKQILPLLLLLSSLSFAEIKMPKDQTFYISGVAFDTKTYCADFHKVIQQQAQKIKMLEQEIMQLRQLQQQQLSETLEKKHQQELKEETTQRRATETKSKIIISDKPIQ
jgi:TolA-binding protein